MISVGMIGMEEDEDAELFVAVGDSVCVGDCDLVCLVTLCVVSLMESVGRGFICLGM